VVIALDITGNSQMSIMMTLEESRNHLISRLCPNILKFSENIFIISDDFNHIGNASKVNLNLLKKII